MALHESLPLDDRAQISTVRFIAFDQLGRDCAIIRSIDKASDLVLFIESDENLSSKRWHIQRIFFLISSARHFARELSSAGYRVLYLRSENFASAFEAIDSHFPKVKKVAMEPPSFRLHRTLLENGFTLLESDLFLTSKAEFRAWADLKKSLLMENFYRAQRARLDILMDGNQPLGGTWNFDHDNRLPPPKNHRWPDYLRHERDEIDADVLDQLRNRYPDLWGDDPDESWATSRSGALLQLEHFVTHHLKEFGPLEDAMPKEDESWQVHHSLLSPYLNNGLLHPKEVIDRAIARFEEGDIPLSSIEGFVRQIIGWREYVYGIYWLFGEEYRKENRLRATRPLLPLFHEPEKTKMACVNEIVSSVEKRAWVHHIPRLMVLSNLALLTGIDPEEFLDWMSEVFIDAYDWVMVPNVIGMGVHADGGKMMTKPYAAGGAYISRMSNYCKGCAFDPKTRSEEDSCPFTTLYWDFLDRHREEFSKNHRIAQQVRGLDRLKDLEQLRGRASEVLSRLSDGTL
jgi:deoxyribodipyrimidine photolyase-related protein